MTTQTLPLPLTYEPGLQELIDDPTVKLLMDRDGVSITDLTDFMALARKRLLARRWQNTADEHEM